MDGWVRRSPCGELSLRPQQHATIHYQTSRSTVHGERIDSLFKDVYVRTACHSLLDVDGLWVPYGLPPKQATLFPYTVNKTGCGVIGSEKSRSLKIYRIGSTNLGDRA